MALEEFHGARERRAVARYGYEANGRSTAGEERLANGLGWFSIGLGLAEAAAPGRLANLIGIEDDEEVRVTADGRSHWRAKAPLGRTVEWDSEVTEDRPNEYIGWRSLADADVPNRGSVRFEKATGGRGTTVRVELHYDPPGGMVGATLAKLFGREPGQEVQESLRTFRPPPLQRLQPGDAARRYSGPRVHGRGDGGRPRRQEAEGR
jgi:hypothetical protein